MRKILFVARATIEVNSPVANATKIPRPSIPALKGRAKFKRRSATKNLSSTHTLRPTPKS